VHDTAFQTTTGGNASLAAGWRRPVRRAERKYRRDGRACQTLRRQPRLSGPFPASHARVRRNTLNVHRCERADGGRFSKRCLAPCGRHARSVVRRHFFRRDHIDADLLPTCLPVAARAPGEPSLLPVTRRSGRGGISRMQTVPSRVGPRRHAARRRPSSRAQSCRAHFGRRAQWADGQGARARSGNERASPASCARARDRRVAIPSRAHATSPRRHATPHRDATADHRSRLRQRIPKPASIQFSVP
jgi:hypothetical protein